MPWHRVNRYTEAHSSGATVTATRTGNSWLFSAWTAPKQPELSFWAWHEAHCCRVTRAPGDRTPQRRACLGVRDSATEARALIDPTREPTA